METIVWHYHHLVPKHIGGTDDPSNLLKCNIAMHAFLHEQLYKEHGRWQDKLAYEGLRGLKGSDEILREVLSTSAKESFMDPERVKSASDNMKKQWRDPEFRKLVNTPRLRDEHSKRMTGSGNPNSKSVIVDGKTYENISIASRELGINRSTLSWRLRNDYYKKRPT